MSEWQPFNVNHTVRVQLTDEGRQLLREGHQRLWADWPKPPYEYSEPKEDADGWSEWQLWSLMHDLGPHCVMGNPAPFKTTIEFRPPTGPK